MEYTGESLAFGEAGKALVALAFVAALLSVAGYVISVFSKSQTRTWQLLGRYSFVVHGLSVLSVFGLLFYLIYHHYFEYYYVWAHSSTDLDSRYIFACIWEGQEGSFLLWLCWHVVLCGVIIWRSRQWEAPVMAVMMMVQVFLASMIIGVYVGEVHIGSSPFTLLREHPTMYDKPFVQSADYLAGIIKQGGKGLNPLLQNYWMTIHPPTLFLGFASTLIPFAFALGGLITGKVKEWIKPALPYTIFGIMILGTGILMGAAWAYEALSFGGFWAWDPVENASLIPWLTLVAAAHVMIITLRTNRALPTSLFLCIITFLLILYSTFLTRSGILGDTSVHAFTDLGMSGQLLLYMAFFAVLGLGCFIFYAKRIYTKHEEEKFLSREFWMFIGALIVSFSAIQILVTTSIPVYNKIAGTTIAPPKDVVDHYNMWQVPIAALLCLGMAITQYFKWRNSDGKTIMLKLLWPLLAAIVATVVYWLYIPLPRPQQIALLFCTLFAALCNIEYIIISLKGSIRHAGASISHIGIALILLGALISNGARQTISENRLNVNLGKDFPNNENIMLLKNDTLRMDKYYVSYTGKKQEGKHIYYNIDYFTLEGSKASFIKQFSLQPYIQLNERMGNVAEPATKHFWNKDIYSYIQYAELDKADSNKDEYTKNKEVKIKKGDTLSTSNSLLMLDDIFAQQNNTGDINIKASFTAIDINNKTHSAEVVYRIEGMRAIPGTATINELGLRIIFTGVIAAENKLQFSIAEKKTNSREFIIMKAMVFPHINILWIGCLLMCTGTMIAIWQRLKTNKIIGSPHANYENIISETTKQEISKSTGVDIAETV